MPSIELSQEQADALARGENVVLSAKKRVGQVERYIAVRDSGHVFAFELKNDEQQNVQQVHCPPGKVADVYSHGPKKFRDMPWYTVVKVK